MPLFSKVFKSKDANKKVSTSGASASTSSKPQWVDSWLRTRVDPDEVAELLHGCTQELKSRALDIPFLLLPFRPSSDPSAARTFIRNYFTPPNDRPKLKGEALINELKMTEVMVLISVMKWCWARIPGGIVSWETYKMFKVGEKDSRYARDSFQTFVPVSVDSKARLKIITDFFDLMAALAAHGKTNGLSGHKLSRFAGWWAFEHYDTGKGFEAGYKAWNSAASATCHLFFAYLRSQSPEPGKNNGILDLPKSLQQLVATTTYPPPASLLSNDTTKVVMVVDVVSPTPYALLRRAKHFEYRDDDRALQQFSDLHDPVDALTDECRRVLRAISNTNQSAVSNAKTSTSLIDPSWSRFEDIGFSSALDDINEDDHAGLFTLAGANTQGLSTSSRSPIVDLNRPTTPSWADFLSSGFVDENGMKTTSPMLLAPDQMLPPIVAEPRGQSSQSHRRNLETSSTLEPGELASITKINVDDAFWWVWISSLAGEEPTSRKACFGRCAFVETNIPGGRWMVMEEQVKGAAPDPVQGAYIAEKKSFLSFTKRGRLSRRRSGIKKSPLSPNSATKSEFDPANSASLAPDQQARIQKAAMEQASKKKAEETVKYTHNRRGRFDDPESRANSVFTVGPNIKDEASPAMQWAKQYDKNTIRAQYLGNQFAGKGSSDFLALPTNGLHTNGSTSTLSVSSKEKDLPTIPQQETDNELSPAPAFGTTTDAAVSAEPESQAAHVAKPGSFVKDEPRQQVTAEPIPLTVQPVVPTTEEPQVDSARNAARPVTPESRVVGPATQTRQEMITVQRPSEDGSSYSKPASPEQTKRKSVQGDSPVTQRNNGIRRIFGTLRKNKEDNSVAPPPAPRANPAVAAARRALESKINPPAATAPVQNNFAKYKGARTPIAAATAVATIPNPAPKVMNVPQPMPEPSPAPAAVAEIPEPEPEPEHESEPELELEPEVKHESEPEMAPAPVAKDEMPAVPLADSDHQPPKTRRDEEFDNLSRVDTREREQADQEFSRFDQGPLLDQPAALPASFTLHDDAHEDSNQVDKHQSVYSAVTLPVEDTDSDDEADQEELTKEASANDRWAQIRRNAAERAARFSDDHGTRSRAETKTDDGDTSGEETIESRVARIKARVAELTGNMEGLRR